MIRFLVTRLFNHLKNRIKNRIKSIVNNICSKLRSRLEIIDNNGSVLTLVIMATIELFLNLASTFGYISRPEELLSVGKNCDLSGRVILITNGMDDLGIQLTVELFKRGAIVIACYGPEDSRTAAAKIKTAIGQFVHGSDRGCRSIEVLSGFKKLSSCPQSGVIVIKELDLSSFYAIEDFVLELQQSRIKLNCIINNQDSFFLDQVDGYHGIEMTNQVNYFGPTYLMSKLYHSMREWTEDSHGSSDLNHNSTSPKRIGFSVDSGNGSVDTCSLGHRPSCSDDPVVINFSSKILTSFGKKVTFEEPSNAFKNYLNSKSAMAQMTKEAVQRLAEFNFRFYLVDTGFKNMDIEDCDHSDGDGQEVIGEQEDCGGKIGQIKARTMAKLLYLLIHYYNRIKKYISRNPTGIVNHVFLALTNGKYNCNKFVLKDGKFSKFDFKIESTDLWNETNRIINDCLAWEEELDEEMESDLRFPSLKYFLAYIACLTCALILHNLVKLDIL